MPELESGIPPLDDAENTNPDGTEKKRRGRPPGSISKLKLDELTEKISTQLIDVTVPLGIVSPLAYDYLCDQAESTARALTRIAAKNPKARKALEKFATGSDWAEVIKLPIGMSVGMMIDFGRIKPEAMIGRPFSMPERVSRLYSDNGGTEGNPDPVFNGSFARGMGAEV